MFSKAMAAAAAAMMAATPALAAEVPAMQDQGARRSGATVGAYYKIPLGGGTAKAKTPRGGFRLTMTHDYRNAGAQTARVVHADALELRLTGVDKPTLFAAGRPITGKEARKNNLGQVTGVVSLAILAAAAVGAYFIYRAVDDSGEE
jgi:hypothetical protein